MGCRWLSSVVVGCRRRGLRTWDLPSLEERVMDLVFIFIVEEEEKLGVIKKLYILLLLLFYRTLTFLKRQEKHLT